MTFYVTFGQKSPFRNGYVKIEADGRDKALEIIEYSIGLLHYCMLYEEEKPGFFRAELFPKGQLGETLK